MLETSSKDQEKWNRDRKAFQAEGKNKCHAPRWKRKQWAQEMAEGPATCITAIEYKQLKCSSLGDKTASTKEQKRAYMKGSPEYIM